MTDVSSDLDTYEPSVLWLWILVGFAAALAIVLLFSSSVLSFITQVFGVRAVQLGLRVRSSALFNWMLLVLDVAIAVFFLVLLLVTVSLLFDGFHKHRDNLLLAGQAHEGAIGMSLLVWASLATRVACFVFWQRCRFGCVRSVDVDYRVDPLLLALAAMSLLWAFPWPHKGLVDFIPHLASQVDDRDPLVLLVLLVLLGLVVLVQYLLLQSTWAARIRLHRQVASIPVVTWNRLHHQAPCDGADGVTHVDVCNLHAGGWPVDKQRIFVRPQVAGQWRRLQGLLEDEDHSTLKVEGPPGTGKSTVAWAWACYMARQQSVVWVQCDRDDHHRIALLGGGRVSGWTLKPTQGNKLVDIAERIALWASAALMIVDGITEPTRALLTSAAGWAQGTPGRRAVTVSSVKLHIKPHIADNKKMDQIKVYSWT